MHKKGVLLINLGTPDHSDTKSVRVYLKEFLNDPRVIDLPRFARWVLTNLLIVPFRYKKSAAAYQQIWTEAGSPLLVNSQLIVTQLQVLLGHEYQVALAMRYRFPSVKQALTSLKDCDSLHIIPLFPQYATASSGSAMANVLQELATSWNIPSIFMHKDFYVLPGFISATIARCKEAIAAQRIEHYVFSFHGLPERQIQKSGCQFECIHQDSCPTMNKANAYCYRAQCYATARAIAQGLGLDESHYSVCFQSRLGSTPWIKPYTDEVLPALLKKGIKNIAIACPSFVADCLETLEEINLRARKTWDEQGGQVFVFIPCVNDHPEWVQSLAAMVK